MAFFGFSRGALNDLVQPLAPLAGHSFWRVLSFGSRRVGSLLLAKVCRLSEFWGRIYRVKPRKRSKTPVIFLISFFKIPSWRNLGPQYRLPSVSSIKNGDTCRKTDIRHLLVILLEPCMELTVKDLATGIMFFNSFTGFT